MPALPVINDVFRCALNWTDPTGQTATNVIHIRANFADPTPTLVMGALDSSARADMWDSATLSSAITDVAITPLDGVSATEHFTPATPAHWKGEQSGDFIPQVAVVVKLTTGERGRSHRGRVFVPFTCETVAANGSLGSSVQAAMLTAWENFQGNLEAYTHPCQLDVASYKEANSLLVTGFFVEGVLGTQRRRQGRLRGA